FYYRSREHLDLHSFPTRRSSDLEDTFQLQLKDGQAKVVQGDEEVADCILKMSFKSFQQFLTGKLSGTVAFMTGKLKLKGDISKRSEEHTSELQSRENLVCRLLLE